MSERKMKAIVCGSTFGQFYCEALSTIPDWVEFDGILSTGSERSRRCAERYGVNCYTSNAELDSDITLACVVARSGVLGGNGTKIALELLEKGINVIQEQPVHYKDIELCVKAAKKNKVLYRVGNLYEFLPNVKCFIQCSKKLCTLSKPLYLDVGCASQVSYPLIKILSESLPTLRPFEILSVSKEIKPYDTVTAVVGDIPVLFQVQNEVNPDDPDNFMHYLHKITMITDYGRLCLEDTLGSVTWYNKMFVPVHGTDLSILKEEKAKAKSKALSAKSSITVYAPEEMDFGSVFASQWIPAIAEDVKEFIELIEKGTAAEINSCYTKTIFASKVWHQFTSELGFPVLIKPTEIKEFDVESLIRAAIS